MIHQIKGFRHTGAPIVDMTIRNPVTKMSRQIRALIDTGCDLMHVDDKIVRDIDLIQLQTIEVAGAGNHVSVKPVFKGDLLFSGEEYDGKLSNFCFANFFLIASPCVHADAIIGWSILRFFNISFFDDGHFELSHDSEAKGGPKSMAEL